MSIRGELSWLKSESLIERGFCMPFSDDLMVYFKYYALYVWITETFTSFALTFYSACS